MEQKFPCLSPFGDKLSECTTCKARISLSHRVACFGNDDFIHAFMTNKTPSSMKNESQMYQTRKLQKGQNAFLSFFFLSLSSSSDQLIQNCATLSQHFLYKTADFFYTEQCTRPHPFATTLKSHKKYTRVQHRNCESGLAKA